jgi:protein-tyrosine phosphatase
MINNEGLTVYLHCTSGISRAPALLVVYLCLFKRVKQWQSPYHANAFSVFRNNVGPYIISFVPVVTQKLSYMVH